MLDHISGLDKQCVWMRASGTRSHPFTGIYLSCFNAGVKIWGPGAPLQGLTLGMGNWQDPEQ